MHPVSIPYDRSSSLEFGGADEKHFVGGFASGKPPVTLSLVMPQPVNPTSDPGVLTFAKSSSGNPTSSSSTPPSDDTPTNLVGAMMVQKVGISVPPPSAQDTLFYRPDQHEELQVDGDNKVPPYVSFASFDQEAWAKMRRSKQSANSIM